MGNLGFWMVVLMLAFPPVVLIVLVKLIQVTRNARSLVAARGTRAGITWSVSADMAVCMGGWLMPTLFVGWTGAAVLVGSSVGIGYNGTGQDHLAAGLASALGCSVAAALLGTVFLWTFKHVRGTYGLEMRGPWWLLVLGVCLVLSVLIGPLIITLVLLLGSMSVFHAVLELILASQLGLTAVAIVAACNISFVDTTNAC